MTTTVTTEDTNVRSKEKDLVDILIDLTTLLKENKAILPLTAEDVLHEVTNKKLPEAIERLDRFVKKINLSNAMKTLLSEENNEETKKKLLALAHNWLIPVADVEATSPPKDIQKQSYLVNSKPYRGHVLILNNKFEEKSSDNQPPKQKGKNKERKGCEFDVKSLTHAFTELNYDVRLREELTSDEMKWEIKEFFDQDEYMKCDTVGVVIMTHGSSGDVLHGVNDKEGEGLTMPDVLKPFSNKKFLTREKPKFVIIQSCRGSEEIFQPPGLPANSLASCDGDSEKSQIVTMNYDLPSDMLIMHATLPGCLAYRIDGKGSFFIQALCDVMKSHGKDTPMQQWFPLITEKNQDFLKEVYDPKLFFAPQFASTLTKQFYLNTALFEDNK